MRLTRLAVAVLFVGGLACSKTPTENGDAPLEERGSGGAVGGDGLLYSMGRNKEDRMFPSKLAKAKDDMFMWGLARPKSLLTYKGGGEEFCEDPKVLLEHIRDAVKPTPMDGVECWSELPDSEFGRLEYSCTMRLTAKCAMQYRGEIWYERPRKATKGYHLWGLGWPVYQCDAGAFEVNANHRETMKSWESTKLKEILDDCRENKK